MTQFQCHNQTGCDVSLDSVYRQNDRLQAEFSFVSVSISLVSVLYRCQAWHSCPCRNATGVRNLPKLCGKRNPQRMRHVVFAPQPSLREKNPQHRPRAAQQSHQIAAPLLLGHESSATAHMQISSVTSTKQKYPHNLIDCAGISKETGFFWKNSVSNGSTVLRLPSTARR